MAIYNFRLNKIGFYSLSIQIGKSDFPVANILNYEYIDK